MKTRKVPHPGWNLEYMMWLFTRISGLAFFVLAIIGLLAALYMGARLHMNVGTLMRWTFFPNPNHVLDSEIPNIDPWANALWQVFQISILFFGEQANGFNLLVGGGIAVMALVFNEWYIRRQKKAETASV